MAKGSSTKLPLLEQEIVECRRCTRLVEYREAIGREKRRAYAECEYWARPVPGFGDPHARLLLLGLAPGAHGSNRTGRMFTGDSSGRFLYPALYRAGFASQPEAEAINDGLKLTDCWITAVGRCAPPDNKPLPEELANCSEFLDRELALLREVRVVVALGKIAFDGYLAHLSRTGFEVRKSDYKFAHGAESVVPNGLSLLASYHPSNQNTATGKLTEPMFASIFERAKALIATNR